MTQATIATGHEVGTPLHHNLCEWLTANGVDINTVPLDAAISVDGDVLSVEVYSRDAQGRIIRAGEGDNAHAAREVRTVPLVVPPPAPLLS